MSKFIFVTGGVASSLGKGISGASIGKLLQLRGIKVNMIKCDPYLNIDPGTISPYQHGEVFVTADGAQADLDLGTYERFLDVKMTKKNTNTTGTIYQTVLDRERRGGYDGITVQVVPHITNEIKSRFTPFEKEVDVTIIEIGGTVGDIEGLPFLEATRQFKTERGRENVLNVHVTLIPYIASADELKTKPTQHSVSKLREIGIDADALICRTELPMPKDMKEKLALFCSVKPEAVIEAWDVNSIYKVAENFEIQGLTDLIIKRLGLKARKKNDGKWFKFINNAAEAKGKKQITVAIAGKYAELKDAYKSIAESLHLAAMSNNANVKIKYIDTRKENFAAELKGVGALIVPAASGRKGIEGKIAAIKYARERKIPFLGISTGMHCAVIEAARQAGAVGADSAEHNPQAKHKVVDFIATGLEKLADGIRRGDFGTKLKKGSLAQKLYKKSAVLERHRHRYEINPIYNAKLEAAGLLISGVGPGNAPTVVERADHPFFIAVQYHPEFAGRPMNPHPLFDGLLKAALKKGK